MDWDPDAIPDKALGELQEEYRPTPGTAAAGFILAMLSGAAAILFGYISYWIAFVHVPEPARQPQAFELPLWVFSLLFLMAVVGLGSLAILFWLKAREAWNAHTQVFAHGLRRRFEGYWQTAFWSDIAVIRETQTYQRPPIFHFPASLVLPKMKSSAFCLTMLDGSQWDFDGDTVNRIGRLGKRLKEVAAHHGSIVWEVETVQVGE